MSQDGLLTEDEEFFREIYLSIPETPAPSPTPTTRSTRTPVEDATQMPSATPSIMPIIPTSTMTTTIPAKQRDLLIQAKCGITAIERSRDILAELLTVSDSSSLINPETSQGMARDWLDNIDPGIICSENAQRVHQRYRLALVYYELGGNEWTRCRARGGTIPVSSSEEDYCPGKPFLDKGNECEWYGMDCGDAYNDVAADWLDEYYPLEVLDLQSNNLAGELFDEFYGFQHLKEVFLNNNNLGGTIQDEIGNFVNVTVLQLESNSFDGLVPEAGLLKLERLAGLSIQGNQLQGSIEELCDVRDDRRVQFESYLSLMVEADCLGVPPEVACSCCTCF